jgi:hypothetical protein
VSGLASLVFITLILGLAFFADEKTLALYSLSFWYYYLYGLAFYYGAVALRDFKRDAILMKAVSLLALGSVYFAAPVSLTSLVVMAAGFLLNSIAASVLGSDRTYYGYEVADLPPRRITAFPYSWIAHPMLVGNMAAFGGTLLNAEFRRDWWPLAATHVVMNLGLLVMELCVTPQRRSARRGAAPETDARSIAFSIGTVCCVSATGAIGGAALCSSLEGGTMTLLGAGTGACIAAYAYVLYLCYSEPKSVREHEVTFTQGNPHEQ